MPDEFSNIFYQTKKIVAKWDMELDKLNNILDNAKLRVLGVLGVTL